MKNVYDEQGNQDGWLVDASAALHVDPYNAGRTEIIFSINLGVAENTLSHDVIREFANAKVGQLFQAIFACWNRFATASIHRGDVRIW